MSWAYGEIERLSSHEQPIIISALTICNEKKQLRRLQPLEKRKEKTIIFFPLCSHSGGTRMPSTVLWKQYYFKENFSTSRSSCHTRRSYATDPWNASYNTAHTWTATAHLNRWSKLHRPHSKGRQNRRRKTGDTADFNVQITILNFTSISFSIHKRRFLHSFLLCCFSYFIDTLAFPAQYVYQRRSRKVA